MHKAPDVLSLPLPAYQRLLLNVALYGAQKDRRAVLVAFARQRDFVLFRHWVAVNLRDFSGAP